MMEMEMIMLYALASQSEQMWLKDVFNKLKVPLLM